MGTARVVHWTSQTHLISRRQSSFVFPFPPSALCFFISVIHFHSSAIHLLDLFCLILWGDACEAIPVLLVLGCLYICPGAYCACLKTYFRLLPSLSLCHLICLHSFFIIAVAFEASRAISLTITRATDRIQFMERAVEEKGLQLAKKKQM